MSSRQKNPQCSPEQPRQSHSEMPGLEIAQVSKALEETHLSSPPPMPGNSKGLLMLAYLVLLRVFRVSTHLPLPSEPPHQANHIQVPVTKRRKIAPHRLGQTPGMCP